jgi:hypothetical protein
MPRIPNAKPLPRKVVVAPEPAPKKTPKKPVKKGK